MVLGRSELSLEAYFQRLQGKAEARVVCMDLAANYRALVRLHFLNARIVADRFHVIRIINHHFLACWPAPGIEAYFPRCAAILTTSPRISSFAWPLYLAEHPVEPDLMERETGLEPATSSLGK